VKIYGVTLGQIGEAMTTTPHAWSIMFADKTPAGATSYTEGFFKGVKDHAHYAATKYSPTTGNYDPYYGPCWHFYKAFHKALKSVTSGAWTMYVGKVKLTYTHVYHVDALQYSFEKQGIKCAHSGAHNAYTHETATPEVADAIASATPAPAPPPTAKHLLEVAPLTGPAMTPGDITGQSAISAIRSTQRDVYPATTTMYVLEDLYVAASQLRMPVNPSEIPDGHLGAHYARLAWARQLIAYRAGFADTLARNFFDFCAMAAFGEFRYGTHNGRYTVAVNGKPVALESRAYAYEIALTLDPRQMLPLVEHVFRIPGMWGGNIGGKKWANIAKAAGLYFKLAERAPIAFSDHCVDLAHNGGLAFNKGYLLKNPRNQADYMAMLDCKRHGSLLASKLTLEVSPECATLVYGAVACGIITSPTAKLVDKVDTPSPRLTWGTGTLEVRLKSAAGLTVSPDDGDATTSETPSPSGGYTYGPSAKHSTVVTDLAPE